MGFGDQLMGAGMARGAYARKELIAFGDETHRNIIWDHNSEAIYRNNPNVARPGAENGGQNMVREFTLKWIPFYRSHRIYNREDSANERWIWNMDWRPIPGEMFFDDHEKAGAAAIGGDWIIIEPNVPPKRSAVNKLWPLDRYQWVADHLARDGHQIAQFQHPHMVVGLRKVKTLESKNFRRAAALVKRCKMVITAEGGLHHAAAAMNKPAVVLFGGFIPISVTGYLTHENIAVGEACGKYVPCEHCTAAMASITPEQVYEAAKRLLA